MLQNWLFHHPVRIRFGEGVFDELVGLVPNEKILLISTPGWRARGVVGSIERKFSDVTVHEVTQSNPSKRSLEEAFQILRGSYNAIVALGGGSVMDTAKCLSVLLSCPAGTSLKDAVEISRKHRKIPWIAIPTTAGTGSEVTPFAALWDGPKKESIDDPLLFASLVLWDPRLTVSMPTSLTLTTGLDALSQCFESLWNVNKTALTRLIALDGIRRIFHALPRVLESASDSLARYDMALSSLFSGLAISHTRTALAHSISYPLTGHYGIDHGLACSFTLPEVLIFNADSSSGAELELDCRALGFGDVHECASFLGDFLKQVRGHEKICSAMNLESLTAHIGEMRGPRAFNNLRSVSDADIENLLTSTWKRMREAA